MGGGSGGSDNSALYPQGQTTTAAPTGAAKGAATPTPGITAGGMAGPSSTLLTSMSPNTGSITLNGRVQTYRTNLGAADLGSASPLGVVGAVEPNALYSSTADANTGSGDRG